MVSDVLSIATDIHRCNEVRPINAGLDIEVSSVQGGAFSSRARVTQSKTVDIETPRQVDLQESRRGAGAPLIAIASGDAAVESLRRAFVGVTRRAAGRRFVSRHVDAAAHGRGDVGKDLEFVNARRDVVGLLGLGDVQSYEARRRCANRMSGDALSVAGHVHYRGEVGPISADLDVEGAGVKAGALASRARVPCHKARNAEVLSQVYLQELDAGLRAPLIAIASGDAPIKRLRRAFVGVARRAACRRLVERHISWPLGFYRGAVFAAWRRASQIVIIRDAHGQ